MFSMSSDNPIADEVSTRVALIITNPSPPCLGASVVGFFCHIKANWDSLCADSPS
jgi:hypothetical protein